MDSDVLEELGVDGDGLANSRLTVEGAPVYVIDEVGAYSSFRRLKVATSAHIFESAAGEFCVRG